MDSPERRMSITLDAERGRRLRRLAERARTSEGALAGLLLSTALDETCPQPRYVEALLNRIPGAFDRAMVGRAQAGSLTDLPLDHL